MSRAERRARGQRGRLVEGEPVALVVDALRAQGCVCEPPGIYFDTGPMRFGEIGHISVAHDDHCPLAPHRNGRGRTPTSALVVLPPDEASTS